MRSQIEKNKEALLDYIENHAEDEMKPDIAARLSNARGAYKALCMVGKGEYRDKTKPASNGPEMAAMYFVEREKGESTPELDGDSEFERVIMKIPADREHMVKLTHIFDRHLTALRAVNAKPYNTVMEQLKELAKS